MTDLDKAREEYKHALRSTYVSRDADECGRTYGLVDEDKADVLIAALQEENDNLKCCVNCKQVCYLDEVYYCGEPTHGGPTQPWHWNTKPSDPCHFTPSRWQRREP